MVKVDSKRKVLKVKMVLHDCGYERATSSEHLAAL